MILTPLTLALFAFVGWGFTDLFVALNSRALGSSSAALWQTLLTFFFYTLLMTGGVFFLPSLSLSILLVMLFLVILGILSVLCLYEGMRRGNAAISGAIVSCFSAIVVVLSVIFFQESLTTIKVVAIAIIIAGIILTSTPLRRIRKMVRHDAGIPWALAAMVLYGVYFTFIRIPAREIGPFSTAYLYNMGFLPGLLAIMYFRREPIRIPPTWFTWIRIGLHSMAMTVGEIAYNIAIVHSNASFVAPLSSSYPVLFVVLAFLVLREKIYPQQWMGIVLTLMGIVTLAVSG